MLSEYDIGEGDTVIVHLSSGWRPPWWLLLFTALELVRFLTEILDDFRRFVDEIWRF